MNAEGRRFVDEGEDYRNYTYAKFGRKINEQPGGVAWQIWDSKIIPLLREEEYADDVVRNIRGDTLEDLIDRLCEDGIRDRDALTETLSRYNEAVKEQQSRRSDLSFDPAVKDRLSTIGIVPPKTNWAQTIESPPFLAVKVACGITFTFYGLKIDANSAAVIGANEHPVPGVFCAGEMVSETR